jgi:hypothetical protein
MFFLVYVRNRDNVKLNVSYRCVEEKDKPIAMGFGMTMGSLCAFIPSPILFGIILGKDKSVLQLPTNSNVPVYKRKFSLPTP